MNWFRRLGGNALACAGLVFGCAPASTPEPLAPAATVPSAPAVAETSPALDAHVLALVAAVERCPVDDECAVRDTWQADSPELATPLAQQTIWSLLDDPNDTRRMLVLQRWARVPPDAALREGPHAARLLARTRREPNDKILLQLANQIVRIEAPNAAPDIRQIAIEHPRAAFRIAMAHAWEGRAPSPLSLRALEASLTDANQEVQLAAIQALASERYAAKSEACGMLRTRMLSSGAHPGAALFAATRSRCPELLDLASTELPKRLHDVNDLNPRDATEYGMAAEALCLDRGTAKDREGGMAAARQLVKSRAAFVRHTAGRVAAHCDAKESTALLRTLGRDADPWVAESARQLLAEQGHRTAPTGIQSIGLLSGAGVGSESRLVGQKPEAEKPKPQK